MTLTTGNFEVIFSKPVLEVIFTNVNYDQNDELIELKMFLRELILLRYRKLTMYIFNPYSSRTYIPQGKIKDASVVHISREHLDLRQVFAGFLDSSNISREIGYLVTVWIDSNEKCHFLSTSFTLSEIEAEK